MDFGKIANALGEYVMEKGNAYARLTASTLRKASDEELERCLRRCDTGEISNATSELVRAEARRRGLL